MFIEQITYLELEENFTDGEDPVWTWFRENYLRKSGK